MNLLKSIASDYETGETTCLFLHDKNQGEMINLLTVFELVPSEQVSSEMLGTETTSYMERENVSENYTLYIARLINQGVNDLIAKYEEIENGFNLSYESLSVDVKFPYTLNQEPPEYNPLLISSKGEKTIGRVLPKRNTAFRVWSKLNTNKDWLKDFDEKIFDKLSIISRNFLGYDLNAIPEHIGNVYLCASNPLLRKWSSSLVDKQKDLYVQFFERKNRTVIGCTLVLSEQRFKRPGFTISATITSNKMRVLLPYFPHSLRTQIIDQDGNLIEDSTGTWLNLQFSMNIQESTINYTVQTKKGEEIFSVPKTSKVSTSKIGKFDLTVAKYLQSALESRKFEELEENKEFIFFPKDVRSKLKAKNAIKEILNKASKRCMILDPYFGADDLVYAFAIQNISIPIRIISSASFLKESIISSRVKKKSTFSRIWNCVFGIKEKGLEKETYATQLLKGIESYHKQYSLQKIECKVLLGKKSPLHDRYIIVDDCVYLLGSSLNEFGARATTVIKVPTPVKMIEQAENWWSSEEVPLLETYTR